MFGLFSKGAEIELATDREAYLPGEEVDVRVAVRADGDLKAGNGWVDLVYENRYRYSDSDGIDLSEKIGSAGGGERDEVLVDDHCLFEGTALKKGVHEYRARLRLPELAFPADEDLEEDWAPPSYEGELVGVAWKVRARLYLRRARDVVREVNVTVLSPAAGRPTDGDEPERSGAGCNLSFEGLSGRRARPGQELAGTLLVAPREGFDARGVRVELVRRERVPHGAGNTRELVETTTPVEGPIRFLAGETREYRFGLTVPHEALPSLETGSSSVRWLLRAVVDRPLRPDDTLGQELHVYNGPDRP